LVITGKKELIMAVGVQFTGTVAANATQRWFTFDWNPDIQVQWTVVPETPDPVNPQIEWSVEVQRASATAVTYWISVHNLTEVSVNIEGRYAIMT
jgi:hypothetical protein